MLFFKKFKKKVDVVEIIKKVESKNYGKRFFFVVLALLIGAASFNLFFEPNNIVIGGLTGISLIVRNYINIEISTFVMIVSIFLLIISFIFLGKEKTLKTLLIVLIYPFFIEFTKGINSLIDLNTDSLLLIVIYAGIIDGITTGMILKQGFSSGGTQIITQIMNKYLHISLGKAGLIINAIIIAIASLTFGITKSLYAIVALYISSIVTDKVILGISFKKAFYIITSKEEEVKDFIIKNLSHSITIIDVKGGFTDKKKKILLCVIPTNKYFLLKEVVKEIDKDAFFLITDAYEVIGGS